MHRGGREQENNFHNERLLSACCCQWRLWKRLELCVIWAVELTLGTAVGF
jgi:hypothetical protein